MSDVNINQVLAQMRSMSLEASNKPQESDSEGGSDFALLLKQSIDSVNSTQKQAGQLKREFETGNTDVSLAEVMIASQKASVSFQAMLQVRNKLVDAYQEIMNIPL
ncbi:MAG: flagellar hook-basal body complex protein FliE [Methylobacter sp.]|nr:MAG: flagellar hook-basal body complex protein FliE [Methylobacter sp.]PPD04383.1 MAG: flagellar hook-basal body complex protein FliE [Methylobacter sp.]PPD37437.1 MAG: flagellar hook-basal body complex protein FliE [Methylomonas sp.]